MSKPNYAMRQLKPGETGTIMIIATSRTSAKAAANNAAKKLKPGTLIAIHHDPANYMFEQNWLAYAMPE